jgi:hypothetical protein
MRFVGSLLFWIVQRALGSSPTDQDIQAIKYLVSQGADCEVPLFFMKFNSNTLAGQLSSASGCGAPDAAASITAAA